ncbi:hypothetical protein glysoja_005632 [Glycine soja]|nr:hypothetical protein glysoja_005632 [Glycine soja]
MALRIHVISPFFSISTTSPVALSTHKLTIRRINCTGRRGRHQRRIPGIGVGGEGRQNERACGEGGGGHAQEQKAPLRRALRVHGPGRRPGPTQMEQHG